jgi:hypothetical protein
MSCLAITLVIAAGVAAAFASAFGFFVAANRALPIGSGYYVSELQESVMNAGLGFTLMTLIVFFPANAGTFGGNTLFSVTTRVNVGDRTGLNTKVQSARRGFKTKA